MTTVNKQTKIEEPISIKAVISGVVSRVKGIWIKEKKTIKKVPLAIDSAQSIDEKEIKDLAKYNKQANQGKAAAHLMRQVKY